MRSRCKRGFNRVLGPIGLAVGAAVACACATHTEPAHSHPVEEPSGEPEQYSATVVRTIEDGLHVEVSITRTARLGQMSRDEWDQAGETRVAIWRPDLSRVYQLSIERRIYVESESGPPPQSESARAPSATSSGPRAAEHPVENNSGIDPVSVDRSMDTSGVPESEEIERLPDQEVDGRICVVFRRRATFSGGTVETTRSFHSREFNWLALRIESETERAGAKIRVVTERRDIKTDVSPDQFEVPNGYQRVSSLDLP